MISQWFVSLGRSCLKVARKTVGLALIFSVGASTATANYGPQGVPEIDPGSIIAGLVLLACGLLLVLDRCHAMPQRPQRPIES